MKILIRVTLLVIAFILLGAATPALAGYCFTRCWTDADGSQHCMTTCV